MKRDNNNIMKDIESTQSQDLVDSKQQQQLLVVKSSKTILAQREEEEEDDEQRFHHHTNNNNKNNSKHKTTMTAFSCFKGRWLLLLSMTTALIITAILVAMLTISLLDNEDQCFNSSPFQQPSYKLFSTKTTYSTSYNLLNNSLSGGGHPSGGLGLGGGANYDSYKYRLELPNIFSKSDSLKTLNERLTSREFNCKVRQLHYFGRHAARYPSSEDIDFINKQLLNVQNRIDLSKFSQNHQQQPQNNNNNNNKSTDNAINNSTSNPCWNPLADYKQWVSFLSQDQGNLIMESGLKESLAIAQRFKSIYPELFDADQARIEIGTTDELRTAQTAVAFLKQFDNFKLGICNDNLESFEPTTTTSKPAVSGAGNTNSLENDEELGGGLGGNNNIKYKVSDLRNNQCYKQFLNKFNQEKLQFHKKCQNLHREQLPLSYNLNLNEPNRTRFITNSLNKKLKLSKEDSLSPEETQAIYKICKYESALTGSSIWCNLFSDSDLKFYEYLGDIDDFFNQAYGHQDQMRSACPVTTELMRAFKRQHLQPAQQQPEAHFYFTHSEVIQKILAASVDLEQDTAFSLKTIQQHLQEGSTPESRQWRTSLYTPFSANLAFTLYECPRSGGGGNVNGYTVFDVTESPYKVVASLNEQPIQLDGCSGHICDLSELINDSRIDREKRCKLEDICRVNRVFT